MQKLFLPALVLALSVCTGSRNKYAEFIGEYHFGNTGRLELKAGQFCTLDRRHPDRSDNCFYEIRDDVLYITLENGRQEMPMPRDGNCFYSYCR